MFLSLVRVRGFAPKACVLVCASTSSFFSFGFATLAVARGHAASARALCPAGEGSWTTPRTWLSTGPLASSTLSISSSSGAPVGTGAGCSTLGRTSGFGTLQEGAGDFAVPLGVTAPPAARLIYPISAPAPPVLSSSSDQFVAACSLSMRTRVARLRSSPLAWAASSPFSSHLPLPAFSSLLPLPGLAWVQLFVCVCVAGLARGSWRALSECAW